MVIISATPIPGNEKSVSRVINQLVRTGANVIYEALAEVHVSGHARQEELKLIHALTKPKFFIPIHGEYRHLYHHANLAKSMGMPEENVLIPEIGDVVELDAKSMKSAGTVQPARCWWTAWAWATWAAWCCATASIWRKTACSSW